MKKILTKKWWLDDYGFRLIFLILSLISILGLAYITKNEIFKGDYPFQIFKLFVLFMGSLSSAAILTSAVFVTISLIVYKVKKSKK